MTKTVLAAVFLLTASTLAAQQQPTTPDSCVEKIPPNSLTRVPVFLEATADSASRVILPDADLFTQSVAFKLRELLGGNESRLPEGDAAVAWDLLWGEVLVTAHRGGPPTWAVPAWSVMADTLPRSPLRILQRALEAVVASGETVILSDAVAGDSIGFGLSLLNPLVTQSGKVVPLKARQPVPVFTIGVARSKPVELTDEPHIIYPDVSRAMPYVADVRLAFAVDKTGKVDMESVQELWPSGVKRPVGQMLYAYDAFVRAIKRGLPSAKFSPAVLGGCVVRQMVTQTFKFRVN
jgi:hypothetical protein